MSPHDKWWVQELIRNYEEEQDIDLTELLDRIEEQLKYHCEEEDLEELDRGRIHHIRPAGLSWIVELTEAKPIVVDALILMPNVCLAIREV